MSVPKGDRKEGKLQIITQLQALNVYTIQICKNEKNFPKRDRWLLTQRIVEQATMAYTDARKANAIKVVTLEDYKLRREYQIRCRCDLEALLGLIEIAYMALSLEGSRVEYWTKCVMDCEDKLATWRTSDRKRYKDVLKDDPAMTMAKS